MGKRQYRKKPVPVIVFGDREHGIGIGKKIPVCQHDPLGIARGSAGVNKARQMVALDVVYTVVYFVIGNGTFKAVFQKLFEADNFGIESDVPWLMNDYFL